MKHGLIILLFGIMTACCEPPGIHGIQICDRIVDPSNSRPRCSNQDRMSSKSAFISITTQVINTAAEETIVFRVSNSLTGETIVEHVDTIENTGESRINSERCIWDLVHSFELTGGTEWPIGMMDATVEINAIPTTILTSFMVF